jgi:Uma2 family endonuclease
MSTVPIPSELKRRSLRLGRRSNGMLMTPEEFDAVTNYDDCYRYELIHGVLIVSPLPLEAEASPNDELGRLLRNYQADHPQGSALDETLPERYIPTEGSRRRADRVIWAGLGRLPDPEVDVATIAIEFVSSGRRSQSRDYEEKRREYKAVGVKEYWIIDRFQRTMTVYRNVPGKPAEEVVPEHGVYRTDLLPGFEAPLARLLALADRWRKTKPKRKRK